MQSGKIVTGAFLLLILATSSHAATLSVSATAPTQDNLGTCAAPLLGVRTGATVMHFQWSGPAAGEDSVTTTAGTAVVFNRNGIPAGSYTIRAWASDGGGAGCDTIITKRFGGPPWKPINLGANTSKAEHQYWLEVLKRGGQMAVIED